MAKAKSKMVKSGKQQNKAKKPRAKEAAKESSDGSLQELDIAQLWKEANDLSQQSAAEWEKIKVPLRKSVVIALKQGELLTVIKRHTPHGTWIPTLIANFHAGEREGQRFMQLYADRDKLDKLDPEWLSKYTISDALAKILEIKVEESRRHIQTDQEKQYEAAKAEAAKNSGKPRSFISIKKQMVRNIKDLDALPQAITAAVSTLKELTTIEEQITEAREKLDAVDAECGRKRETMEAEQTSAKQPQPKPGKNKKAPANQPKTAKPKSKPKAVEKREAKPTAKVKGR